MPRSKKLQDVTIHTEFGGVYRLSVVAGCKSNYDKIVNDYYVTLPWGRVVHGDSAEEAVAKATQELNAQGGQKPEKVIGVDVLGEGFLFNSLSDSQCAEIGISWEVMFRLALYDGSTVYLESDGKTRCYSHKYPREIPWTQEAEDALKRAVQKIHEAREAVKALVQSEEFPRLLERQELLALPETTSKEKV